ncbi:anthocyanidin 3-O-glucosyltransferase 2-like [Amaranthus tricolor]|uniref:anthocyanidin 3-O-glucosyltransferase 2-like n=1 Tax=Amaranthus tricolor TaxID=29722 RepID=UPI0025844205|nr:anthocyanidin 3-O-glucosyltransferase 2-like [Amaranthus tricolor]
MSKTELIFVPTPGKGHLISTIEFTKLIVKHHPEISVLVLVFHMPIHNSSNVDSYIESQSGKIDPNRITFVTLPPLEDTPDPASRNFFHSIVELQKPLIKQAIENRSIKPSGFVLDLMCVNLVDIAKEFQVPSYIYFTTGACLLSLMFDLQKRFDEEGFDVGEEYSIDSDAVIDLPGLKNRVPVRVLPLLLFEKGSGWSKFFNDLSRRFRETDGILINTLMELEQNIIEDLQSTKNIPPIYPVGPILALEEDLRKGRDSIMEWLDVQPSSSVVFLCFGSMGSFDADQVKEIANGLEHSGHRFLWSLRKPVNENSYVVPSEDETFEVALPQGFLDRIGNRGKIIGWAPQVQILSHPAIGGFVSHCGWNSILESMWFGVPIATWPMYSEQSLNAFELVKEFNLAVEIKMDYQRNLKENEAKILVKAEEVEIGVTKLMGMDDDMKDRIRELKNKCRLVLEHGGSSYNWLSIFVRDLLKSSI